MKQGSAQPVLRLPEHVEPVVRRTGAGRHNSPLSSVRHSAHRWARPRTFTGHAACRTTSDHAADRSCRCAGKLELARAESIDGFPYALGQRDPRLGRPAHAVHHKQQLVQQVGIPEILVDLVQKLGHAVEGVDDPVGG